MASDMCDYDSLEHYFNNIVIIGRFCEV